MVQIFNDQVEITGAANQVLELACTENPQSRTRILAVNSNRVLEGQIQFLGQISITGIPGTSSNPDGNGPAAAYRDTGVLVLFRPHGAPGIILDSGGTVQLFHPNGGNPHVELIANELVPDNTGGGLVNVADGQGNATIRLVGNAGRILLPHLAMGRSVQGGGAIELTQDNNTIIIQMGENANRGGELDLFANNGTVVVRLGQDDANRGGVLFFLPTGAQTLQAGANVGNGGAITLFGPNGNEAVLISTVDGMPNNGFVGVTNPAGTHQARMTFLPNGTSIVTADVKSFVVPHPMQPDTDIMYACIEGPEAAVFVRGTTRLVNGEARVALPDHFVHVANLDKMTVQVTPLSPDSMGLAVGKGPAGFVVRELRRGSGNYDFDWEVKCVRAEHEDFQVTRPRGQMAAMDGLRPLAHGP